MRRRKKKRKEEEYAVDRTDTAAVLSSLIYFTLSSELPVGLLVPEVR